MSEWRRATMRSLVSVAFLALVVGVANAADLTPTELRWLKAGWPVVAYAKAKQLPLDIIVQPEAKAGDAPLSLGYDRGRCLLVLSMRRNPDAETALEGIDAALLPAIVEAMFAHELGHCWRYVRGTWHGLPVGFQDMKDAEGDLTLGGEQRSMRDARREEGYADIVALAWTGLHHPERYSEVHAWLTAYRAEQPVDGAHHDTRAWIRLAGDLKVFGRGGTPFEQAEPIWHRGLLSADR